MRTRCFYTRALQRAFLADLIRQHSELRRAIIYWNVGLYWYNERLLRNRWGW